MYKCERCNYATDIKGNLGIHYRRKVPCEAIKSDIAIDELYEKHKSNKEKQTTIHQCELCGQVFSCRQNKSRHKKTCIATISTMLEQKDKIELRNICEIKLLQSQMKELKLEIAQMKGNPLVVNNVNNINININQIVINSFNNINGAHIEHNLMVKLISKTYFHQLFNSLKEVVRLVYYNEKHPENHAIYIPNVRDKFARVYDGKLWLFRNRDEMLTLVRNRSIELMNDFFYDNENAFNLITKQNMRKWHDKYYDDNDKLFDKQTKKAVEETILSYQAIVKKTIDQYNLL